MLIRQALDNELTLNDSLLLKKGMIDQLRNQTHYRYVLIDLVFRSFTVNDRLDFVNPHYRKFLQNLFREIVGQLAFKRCFSLVE